MLGVQHASLVKGLCSDFQQIFIVITVGFLDIVTNLKELTNEQQTQSRGIF